ncbi:MAG: hypothetical protein GFGODING_02574 [Flavobacteriales bacterium]|nr:hypothetical protein [Flavobacteriales bacterium]
MRSPLACTRPTLHASPARPPWPLFLLAMLLPTACKVNYSFSGADIPAAAGTYGVAVFEARAPLSSPRTAQVFTETLRDLLQAQTPLKLVREGGDLRYEGAITGYDVQPVAIQANETAALNRLTITVSVTYTNTLDATRSSTFSVSRFADYDSGADLVAVEEGLVRTISDQLVQDIFDRTLGNW